MFLPCHMCYFVAIPKDLLFCFYFSILNAFEHFLCADLLFQVAHEQVRDQLIKFIYTGFLLPVLGPALHQVSDLCNYLTLIMVMGLLSVFFKKSVVAFQEQTKQATKNMVKVFSSLLD